MSLPFTSSNTELIPSCQFIQFLSSKDISQTIRLIVNHYIIQRKLTSQNYELSNITVHLQKFLQYVIELNTSFIVRSSQTNKITGCSINLDIKDLLVLFEGMINFSVFQMLGMFTTKIKNWVYKLGDAKKGDYLFNVVTVFQDKLFHYKSVVDYLLKGVAFAKIIGWKAILYPTMDPFLMLRLGGEVMGMLTSLKAESEMQYQGDILNQGEEISISSQEKVTLQKVPHQRYTYIVAMHLDKLRFKYVEQENGKVENNSFQEDMTATEIPERKKLFILPKL